MPKLLLVDDTPDSIKVLMEALDHLNYDIFVATSGKMALEVASSQKPDLILLDVLMPEMDGYEVCTKLKVDTITKKIPVIFITAQNDDENETKGFEMGAVDYITKPINPSIVQARVKTHLKLKFAYQELERQNTVLEETACYLATHRLEQGHSYILKNIQTCRGKKNLVEKSGGGPRKTGTVIPNKAEQEGK